MFKQLLIMATFMFALSTQAIAEQTLRLATTTSTDNTGLLDVLHQAFEKLTGISVHTIAVGTGKALRLGENGDVDIVMVHAPAAEKKFIANGFGVKRHPVMHNDFVILGDPDDPANLGKQTTAEQALSEIAGQKMTFVSRGDDSGTHTKEMNLWKLAGIEPSGDWYLSTGQGMGKSLAIADDKLAYVLSDRGTYLAMSDKLDLTILLAGDPALFNPYHIIAVSPQKHADINIDLATSYIAFLTGKQGQNIIRNFKVKGEQLFHPDVITD